MNRQNFFYDLGSSYSGCSDTEVRDIGDWMDENFITDSDLVNLYKTIKYNHQYSYTPRLPQIIKFWGQTGKTYLSSNNFHPQSPFQEILKHREKSVNWIVNNYLSIREVQDIRPLRNDEISFLCGWGDLFYLVTNLKKQGIAIEEIQKQSDRVRREILEGKKNIDTMDFIDEKLAEELVQIKNL